jgi:hypothetical protein
MLQKPFKWKMMYRLIICAKCQWISSRWWGGGAVWCQICKVHWTVVWYLNIYLKEGKLTLKENIMHILTLMLVFIVLWDNCSKQQTS